MTLIEAALYLAGKPLHTSTLASILGEDSKERIRELARALSREYFRYDSALELVELDGDSFALQLKPIYVPYVKRISMRPVLTQGPLKTLSYIAYNQPVVQSRVAKARGSHAYKHIRQLEERGLISTEKLGRTRIIRITEAFLDLLNLSHNPRLMKRQLRALYKTTGEE